MNDSKTYYNSIANTYTIQSKNRIAYLDAVDDFIIKDRKHQKIDAYLDIGSGDGRRGLKIASALNITNTTLLDNSDKMLDGICLLDTIKVVESSIFEFSSSQKFDLITCLWNVIGHFPTRASMHLFFKNVNKLLNNNGVFIFDVNNRYNIAHYGTESVMRNIQNDHFKKIDSGWFTIGDKTLKTKVYIHSPFDIYDYLKGLDLIIEDTFYLDYNSGINKDTFFEGQLLYKIRKNG